MDLFRNFGRLFAFLLRYTRSVRHARALAAVVIVAGTATGLANTALIAIVNQVINGDSANRASLVWAFVAVCCLLPVARFFAETLLIRLAETATLDLRMVMSRRILEAPLRRVEEVGAARVMAALANDTPAVVGALSILPVLCINLAVVGGSLLYMGMLSWRLLGGVVLFLAVGVVAYQVPVMKAQHHIQEVRKKVEEMFRYFRAVGDAVKELKLHRRRREAFLETRLRATAAEIRGHNIASNRLFAAAVSWGQVLSFILIGLIAFWLPAYTTADKVVLTGYTLAILYMVSPIQVIMNSVPQLGRATAAMKRLEEMGISLEQQAVPAGGGDAEEPSGRGGWSSLELRGVTHVYHLEREQTRFTLGPVDLAVHPGEIVFITGGNGSGKTTLAKLITGLYTPESGELRLDGVAVTPDTLPRYQELFSAVFADFFVFDGFLGLDDQRHDLDEQARHYLAELHLDHKVTVEGGKLSTTDLSHGQRKRLGLLTAYLEDRSIYLFDEWAADQDPHFKQVFYYKLLPQLRDRGKTVIAVTHDDRYYHVADRVIKLDYGKVVVDTLADLPPAEAAAAGAEAQPA